MAETRRCPKCQSENVFRSRRRALEYLVPFYRPFRCYLCERRFLMFSPVPSRTSVRFGNRQTSGKSAG